MTDINTVILIGRLTHDIDGRDFGYTQGGTARLNLSIAVNRGEKCGGQWTDKASFFDITVWGKTAENIKPYLSKGKQIAVDGYLDQQRWEKDGNRFSKVCIIANSVQLIGGGKDETTAQQSPGYKGAEEAFDNGFQEDFPFDV